MQKAVSCLSEVSVLLLGMWLSAVLAACDGLTHIASDVAAALQLLRWFVAYSTQPQLSTLVADEASRLMNLALEIVIACMHI
jgi:hypothetical protein